MHQPAHGEQQEPHGHHRPEERRHPCRAAALDREEQDQNRDRDRDHVLLEGRRDEFQAFHRRKHGNRGRDHRVAVEHGRADDAEHHHRATTFREAALGERHQRQRPAFAVVVRAQQDDDVLDGDDEHERPDDQRQHAENGLARHVDHVARFRVVSTGSGQQCLAKRVERAGADVAVDDPDTAQRQSEELVGVTMPLMPGGRRSGGTCLVPGCFCLRNLVCAVVSVAAGRHVGLNSGPGRPGAGGLYHRFASIPSAVQRPTGSRRGRSRGGQLASPHLLGDGHDDGLGQAGGHGKAGSVPHPPCSEK